VLWAHGVSTTDRAEQTGLFGFAIAWEALDWRLPDEQAAVLAPLLGVAPSELTAIALDVEMAASMVPGTRISQPTFVLPGLQRLLELRSRADRWLPRGESGRVGAAKAGWFSFCPACWAEDNIPYLRLHWRVGFLTTCPRHALVLLDRCPSCGYGLAPWRFRLSRQQRSELTHPTIARCHHCRRDLRTARTRWAGLTSWRFEHAVIEMAASGAVADHALTWWETHQRRICGEMLDLGFAERDRFPEAALHRRHYALARAIPLLEEIIAGSALGHAFAAAQRMTAALRPMRPPPSWPGGRFADDIGDDRRTPHATAPDSLRRQDDLLVDDVARRERWVRLTGDMARQHGLRRLGILPDVQERFLDRFRTSFWARIDAKS